MRIVSEAVSAITEMKTNMPESEREFYILKAKELAVFALENLAAERLASALRLAAAMADYGWATEVKS